MPRILTGIQSSGKPHLGNVLGAILPALALSATQKEPSYFFIADLHTLTSVRDSKLIQEHTQHVAAAWLACGLDVNKDVFYRQSRIPEVCELAWYLGCFTPFPMLANAHSFKDKSKNLAFVNAGLFTYPVLMAADIVLYDAEQVPVGKDQRQHLEIARDIASAFNRQMGEILVLPDAVINENVMTVPGTDGRKMSKSYNNYINVFEDEKAIKKAVMSIQTDSTPLEEPKNPDTCNVFALYKLIASPADIETLRSKYINGGYGYGHAKKDLLDVIIQRFSKERAEYARFLAEPQLLEEQLQIGEKKARTKATEVLSRVRIALGFQ